MSGGMEMGVVRRHGRYLKRPRTPLSAHAQYYYTRSLIFNPDRKIGSFNPPRLRCLSASKVMDSNSRSASPREPSRPQQRPPSPPSPPSPPAAGLDNRAYLHDDTDDPNHNHHPPNDSYVSNGNGKCETNGDLKTLEAVNLELINLAPKNGNTQKQTSHKKEVEVDMNASSPYDEYFVPVNEHRKYMRGEKLYVTADKRSEKSGCKRPLCWTFLGLVVAAVVILIVLAATGILFSNTATTVEQYNSTISSARAFGSIGAIKPDGAKDHDHDHSSRDHDHDHDHSSHDHDHGSQEHDHSTQEHDHSTQEHDHSTQEHDHSSHVESSSSERAHSSNDQDQSTVDQDQVNDAPIANQHDGPAIGGTLTNTMPMDEMTNDGSLYVPRTLEGELKIDNEEFVPELEDPDSDAYRQFTSTLSNAIRNALFDKETLEQGDNDIFVEIVKLRKGSVIVTYRIHWKPKTDMETVSDPITTETFTKTLSKYLERNDRMLNIYHVAEEKEIARPVLDVCQMNKNGCEYGCEFDYVTLDFSCTCPKGKILEMDNLKTCITLLEHPLSEDPTRKVITFGTDGKPKQTIPEEETTATESIHILTNEHNFDWKETSHLAETTTQEIPDLKFSHVFGNPTLATESSPEPTNRNGDNTESSQETQTESEPKTRRDPKSREKDSEEPVPTSEPEPKPEPEPTSIPEPEPEITIQPEAEPQPEPSLHKEPPQQLEQAQPTTEPPLTSAPLTESDNKFKTTPLPEPEPKSEPTPEPSVDQTPKPEPAAEPEPMADFVSERNIDMETDTKIESQSAFETPITELNISTEHHMESEIQHNEPELTSNKDTKTHPVSESTSKMTEKEMRKETETSQEIMTNVNIRGVLVDSKSEHEVITTESPGDLTTMINALDSNGMTMFNAESNEGMPINNDEAFTNPHMESQTSVIGLHSIEMKHNEKDINDMLINIKHNNETDRNNVRDMNNESMPKLYHLDDYVMAENIKTSTQKTSNENTEDITFDFIAGNKSESFMFSTSAMSNEKLNVSNVIIPTTMSTLNDILQEIEQTTNVNEQENKTLSLNNVRQLKNIDVLNTDTDQADKKKEQDLSSLSVIDEIEKEVTKKDENIQNTLNHSNAHNTTNELSDDNMDITFESMLSNYSTKSVTTRDNIQSTEKNFETTISENSDSDWLSEPVIEDILMDDKSSKVLATTEIVSTIDDLIKTKDDFEPDYLNNFGLGYKMVDQDIPMYTMAHDYENEDARVKRINKESSIANTPPVTTLETTTIKEYIYKKAEGTNYNNVSSSDEVTLNKEPAPVWESNDPDIKRNKTSIKSDNFNQIIKNITENKSEVSYSETIDNTTHVNNLNVTIYEISSHQNNTLQNEKNITRTHSLEYDHGTDMNPFLPETENNKNFVTKLQEGHDLESINFNETQIDSNEDQAINVTEKVKLSAIGEFTTILPIITNETKPVVELKETVNTKSSEIDQQSVASNGTSVEMEMNVVNNADTTVNNNADKSLEKDSIPISTFLVDTEDLSLKGHTTEDSEIQTESSAEIPIVPSDTITDDDDDYLLNVVPIKPEKHKDETEALYNDISDTPKKSDKRTIDTTKLKSV